MGRLGGPLWRRTGMSADPKMYPKSGNVLLALANLDPPATNRVTDFLDLRLPLEG